MRSGRSTARPEQPSRQSSGLSSMQLVSTLTCPECGHQSAEPMPTDACQFFYDCKGCGIRLKPRQGDCCVYCSYGTVPGPAVQVDGRACSASWANFKFTALGLP